MPHANEPSTARLAIHPLDLPRRTRKPSALIRVPAVGKASTSHPQAVALIAVAPAARRYPTAIPNLSRSSLSRSSQKREHLRAAEPRSPAQLRHFVDVDREAAAVERHDQTEPDHDLARGDDHDDEREDLPVAGACHARERDQREVAGVQHQFEAEQDHERIAPGDDAGGADAEDEAGQDEVPGDRHHQPPRRLPVGSPGPSAVPAGTGVASSTFGGAPSPPLTLGSGARPARSGSSSPPSSSRPRRRRASTTAATAATSSRNDAASNGI